jgi:hypothetical protein
MCRITKGISVDVIVGEQKKIFHLPKAFLCEYIPFFRPALEHFKEGVEGKVYPPEDQPEAFLSDS